jgi:hypothetical protein
VKIALVVLLVACKREASPPPKPEVAPKIEIDAVAIDAASDAAPIDAAVVEVDASIGKPGGVKGTIQLKATTPANTPPGPHPGCTITALEKTTKKVFVGKTNAQGDYKIDLPPGEYAVNFGNCGSFDCSKLGDKIENVTIDGNWKTLSLTAQTCNKCLDAHTRIATPDGDIAIERLRVGDRIVVVRDGARIGTTVAAIQRVAAAHDARRVTLADGRVVIGAPLHPFADGRGIGAVHLGDRVDGVSVIAVEQAPYSDGFAYDILPSIDGAYIAGGVPLLSTMR